MDPESDSDCNEQDSSDKNQNEMEIDFDNEVEEKENDDDVNAENEQNCEVDEDPDNQEELLALNQSTAYALEKEKINLIKKSRKSKKKDNPNTKSCFIKHLLEQNDLPSFVTELLSKEIEECGTIEALKPDELNSFWNDMYQYILSVTKEYMEEKNADSENPSHKAKETLEAIVDLILYSKHCINFITTSQALFAIFAFLNTLLTADVHLELGLKISEVCEICIISGVEVEKKVYIDVIDYLLDVVLKNKNVTKNVILRLTRIIPTLKFVNITSPYCKPLLKNLIEVPKCHAFLSTKEGRGFITLLLWKLDIKLIKYLSRSVKDYLPHAKRSEALAYGEIYYNAWNLANNDFKNLIQTVFFQHLVEHVFTLPRMNNLQSMNQLGQNVFAILKYLHASRRHTNFSKVITNLYAPFIWRHLRCGQLSEKSNAVEVFLDVYPMEKLGKGLQTELAFLEKQQNEMIDLLNDRYHIIRIIAIKGVCAKLKSCWNTFSPESIQVITRTLLVNLANDSSSIEVRKAVFTGMAVLLENENAAKYLQNILPQTRNCVHDINERVRIAYIRMLIKLKKLKYPGFQFQKVVPVKHLLCRLERDSSTMAEAIAELLMDTIVLPEDKNRTLMNICKMIGLNPIGTRKFFGASKNSLKFRDVVKLIQLMLATIRWFVKNKEEQSKNAAENISPEPDREQEAQLRKKKKSSKRTSLEVIQENQVEQREEKQEEGQNEYSLDNPDIVYGMVQIISILWCLQTKKLILKDNESHLNDIYDLAAGTIPLLIKYYKNTNKDIYYSVIYMASLMPLGKLSPTSTIGSACMSQLKSISEASPNNETSVILTALCAWNRSGDIIELVVNALDHAFRPEGLNQSALRPEGYKLRTVKFKHTEEVTPITALHILDIMFESKINQKRVYRKSCSQMYELFECLAKLKVIAENRVILGIPLDNPLLPDDFIVQGIYRYHKTMFFLSHHECEQHQPDSINIAVELNGIMEWAKRIIFPYVPDTISEVPGICERILQDVLRLCILVIGTDAKMVVGNECLKNVAEFMMNLLSFGCSLWFIECCLSLLMHMIEHVEAFSDKIDEAAVMKTTIPVILSHVFLSLSKTKYSQQAISTCIQRLLEVKSVLVNVPHKVIQRYGVKDPVVHSIFKMYVTACVSVICIGVREVQVIDTVDNIKELPVVSSLILSCLMSRTEFKKLWLIVFTKEIKETFSDNVYMLMSCVSLLHTLSFYITKLNREQFSLAVKAANDVVNNFESTQSQQPHTSDDDLSASSISSNLNVKSISLPILSAISDKLGLPPPTTTDTAPTTE